MNEAFYAKIKVEPGDENPAADAFHGVYEKHRQVMPGDDVLDLGAHAGYFTRIASEKAGPTGFVIAFEPHPANFLRLQANCAGNPHIICVQAGASNVDGVQPLWPAIGNSGGHSFTHVGTGQEPTPIMCQVVSIGDWLKRVGFKPTFVKIDTELSEKLIIPNLLACGFRPYIAAEIHNLECWRICRNVLREAGYLLLPESEEFTNYYLWATAP